MSMRNWLGNGVSAVSEKDEDDEADEQVVDLKKRVKELEEEVERWRSMHAQEVAFMRDMIIKLIDKPAGNVNPLLNRPASTLSAKDYDKIAKGNTDNRDKYVDPKAGPVGKGLPL